MKRTKQVVRTGRHQAGLYIRTSSEVQGEKVSPEIQERDCRKYCEDNGMQVVDVYRDTNRYRVKGRLVEPSGTRPDRPEFVRMLKDAQAGRITCIVAWKEDRLYRSFRPMLDVLDLLEEKRGALDLQLVKEHFDMAMAPFKAAMAKMELASKNDRWYAGMEGRLMNGKPIGYNGYGYGYDKTTGKHFIAEEEAKWVHWIWKWYADGVMIPDIHQALIMNGAEQKKSGDNYRKSVWSRNVIRAILARDCYYTGKKTVNIGDTVYTIDVPQLIDENMYNRVRSRQNASKSHPVKFRSLDYSTCWLDGLAYCAHHGSKLTIIVSKNSVKYMEDAEYYKCSYLGNHFDDGSQCCQGMAMGWLDRLVWQRLWDFVSDPEQFEARLLQRIEQLQKLQATHRKDHDKLTKRLDAMQRERQRVALMFRKEHITEDEMDQQMSAIALEESELTAMIADAGNDYTSEINQITELSAMYQSRLAKALHGLQTEPTDPVLFEKWSKAVRTAIRAMVNRVTVDASNQVKVRTYFDIKNPPEAFMNAASDEVLSR